MFPTLATMKTMSTRFQCCSLKMFLSNSESTTMAVHEVEEEEQEEPQASHRKGKGKKERNWKDKEIKLLIPLYDFLWIVVHEYCTNRDKNEVALYCQIDAEMSEKYGIIRDYYKSK